jgi:L-lactate dehydrogenase complex protein LldG
MMVKIIPEGIIFTIIAHLVTRNPFMTSRERILERLRNARRPFPDSPAPTNHRPVSPMVETEPTTLKARFIAEAELLSAMVHQPDTVEAALDTIFEIIGEEKAVIAWEELPLPTLHSALAARGIAVAGVRDASVRVGITGATAALAATGSLVVTSGAGKPRSASLLPPIHIALITEDQLLPNLESWVAQQRTDTLETFRATANTVLISGPSRTADIAMELILGMHGPRVLHIIFCPEL